MPSYLTACDALSLIQLFEPSVSTIKEIWIEWAEAKVNQALVHEEISIPATDINNLLKYATIFSLVDLMGQAKRISHTTGRAISASLGKGSVRYSNENMFFFRTGDVTRTLQYMRQDQTPHQWMETMIEAYKASYFKDNENHMSPRPAMGFDVTRYGFGWNREVSEISEADDDSEGTDYA